MDCIFCKIVKGEIESLTVYEDDVVKVFMDSNPDSNGHMLIVPKKHYVDITDIDMNTLDHIMMVAKKMYDLIMRKLNPDGIKLVQNNGILQVVKHYHLHLIPAYKSSIDMDKEEVYKKLMN